jgi:hypothetical protein
LAYNGYYSNEEILHSGFTIYRKDGVNRCGGGVLIAVKTVHFKSVKARTADKNLSAAAVIVYRMLTCLGWTKFKTFLNHACDNY